MCHFDMGLTHCYKTTVFLHLYIMTMVKKNVGRDKIKAIWQLSRNALEVVFLDEQRTKKRFETLQHDVNGKKAAH